ncbi:MAG: hypothetical protein HKN29_14970 [Rhodothermales bacterium]|nr:hypothetical protein [Rhodothermales bacterium]
MRPFLWPLALLLLFGAVKTEPVRAQVARMTLDELTTVSTTVVHATATESRAVWSADGQRIYTEITLRVEDTLKGQGLETRVVTIPGGQIGDVRYEVSDMPSIEEGEELLAFLWRHPSGRLLVAGGTQGKLEIERLGAAPEVSGPLGLLGTPQAGRLAAGASDFSADAQSPAFRLPLDELKTRIRTFNR